MTQAPPTSPTPPTVPTAPPGAAPARVTSTRDTVVGSLFIAALPFLVASLCPRDWRPGVWWAAGGLCAWFLAICTPYVRRIAELPILLVVAPFVAARARFEPRPTITPADAPPPGVSEASVRAFEARRRELAGAGFRPLWLAVFIGSSYSKGEAFRAPALVEVYEHASTGAGATLMVTASSFGGYTPDHARFHDRLPGGGIAITFTSDLPGMFPRIKEYETLLLPQETPAAEAAAAHRAFMATLAPGRRMHGPSAAGGPAAYAEEIELASFEAWAARRWVVPDRASGPGVYRLAWWLAVRAGWGLIPIVGRIRTARLRAAMRKKRARLGV